MADLSKCRSCSASVIWLRSAVTDKRAPIDAGPSPNGNILIDHGLGVYVVLAHAAERAKYKLQLHLNHYVTCPQARSWASAKK